MQPELSASQSIRSLRLLQRRTRFHFVDFAALAQPGFRNHVVPLDAVAELVTQYAATECYASIFCFSDDVFLYLAEHRVAGQPSIAGYDGKVWAPFLPLDIDASSPGDLETAQLVARNAYRFLREHWHLPAAAVHPYFSGAKGFHLLIDTRVFGRVAAGRDLPRTFSRLRLEILRGLPDAARPLFDLAIGDKVRLLRLPNTRHRGSGLYKVALSDDELMSAPPQTIRTLAAAPRPLPRLYGAGLVPGEPVAAASTAVHAFARARRAVRRSRGAHPYRLAASPAAPEEALCAARRAMWQAQIPPGNRNNVAIRLASALRLVGYAEAQTAALLLAWNRRGRRGLPEREIRGVVHSAYARPYPYGYGCHDEVIRAFCPYVDRLGECDDYRQQHPRSGRAS